MTANLVLPILIVLLIAAHAFCDCVLRLAETGCWWILALLDVCVVVLLVVWVAPVVPLIF